jgi:hypothetical protein
MLKTSKKMITVKAYLYPNTVEVQFFDPAIFTTRNRQVYSRPIKVYQGIDNPIQIIIRNQDQKSINLTGSAVQVDIQDPTNQLSVASYAVNFTGPGADITKGLGTVILDQATVDQLEQRFYKLTVRQINTSTNKANPVYIDDNYGVPLDLEVLPAYYADMAPAPTVGTEIVVDGGTL